jgi:hypothetical protein
LNAAFKSAVEKLASAMVAATDLHGGDPNHDWRPFAVKAIRELPPNQRLEVERANDATFTNALWRAVLRKEALKAAPPELTQ